MCYVTVRSNNRLKLTACGRPEAVAHARRNVIPHTTALRGNRWELAITQSFLKPGVFHLQQIQSVPIVRLERKMGKLTDAELSSVRSRIVELLRLIPTNPVPTE